MKSPLTALILLQIGLVGGAAAQGHDTVWVWNANCPHPTRVAIQVHLDQTTVYRGSLPVCLWERRFEDGKASIHFTPGRALVWSGYRRDGERTAAGAPLDISFWQAGGEPDLIELGYDVVSGDSIYMNSLHLLSPIKRVTTTMAPGLVLDTWPEVKP